MQVSERNPHQITVASGARLDYSDQGRGPAILFVHGYPDSWHAYEPVLRRMPADVRAVAHSHRGFGDSDRPKSGYAMADFAADAVTLMDKLGIAQATVVGHSMGSLVAQELALSHPDRVARLGLIGASDHFDTPLVRELEGAVNDFGDSIPREFVHEFQSSTVHRPVPDAFLEGVVNESMKAPALVWREALAGILAFRSTDRLSRLSVPTLIVGGDRDEVATPAAQQRLHGLIRGSRFLGYGDTGHGPHWEQPGRFSEDLLAFVREA
jgi:pimeloyl-ACP methyl ester carboxylesterase